VDAYEAGLWLFWITKTEVLAVPRPALRIEGDRLHCASGPAVSWPNGTRYWFWRGVQVPEKVIVAPETLTAGEVLGERNAEVRRVMIERLGADRLMQQAYGSQLGTWCCRSEDTDQFGRRRRLLELILGGSQFSLSQPDESLVMLEVVNSTPESDATFKSYLLRVAPDARTAYSERCWKQKWGRPRPRSLPDWDCQAAVAWTYGLLPQEYQPVMET
jgi:hypothetical protein